MNTYEFELRSMCPVVKELIDVYSVTLRSRSTIKVEDILAFIEKYKTQQVFQETVTQEIATGLGVQVQTVGFHSGVKVTCVAP